MTTKQNATTMTRRQAYLLDGARGLNEASVLVLVAAGSVGGLFSGVFGVGGGTLMVPLLLWWARMDQRRANATSLLAITPAAIMGALSYGIGGVFAWLPAIFVALGSILGAQVGAWVLRRIPLVPLRWAFIAFIIASGVLLFLEVPSRESTFELTIPISVILLGLGLFMGIAAGLFGIGGGIVLVPALMVFLGQSDLAAKSVSLIAMAPGAISGSISHLRFNTARLRDGLWVALGAVLTAPIGSYISFLLNPRVAAVAFGVLTLGVAGNLIRTALTTPTKD